MTRYYALALVTKYWKPGTIYENEIINVGREISNGDFIVVSEKAISTAQNNILDESTINPTLTAKIIAKIWMPIVWGYLLGIACHFGQRLLYRIRTYPPTSGSKHKKVALQYAGFSQTLMFGSEGGIDGSNLPYSLVSLPLKNANKHAEKIRKQILQCLGKQVTVVIVDSDKTYSVCNFHFTPRPKPLKGIIGKGGFLAYVIGRSLKLRKRPTPIGLAGSKIEPEQALTIANIADKARGPGSGATVWDMANRFKVSTTEVTWDMLSEIKHKPIVIVRAASTTQRP